MHFTSYIIGNFGVNLYKVYYGGRGNYFIDLKIPISGRMYPLYLIMSQFQY